MVMLIMKLMLGMKRMLLRPVEKVVKVFKESVSGLRPCCHPGREPPSSLFLGGEFDDLHSHDFG